MATIFALTISLLLGSGGAASAASAASQASAMGSLLCDRKYTNVSFYSQAAGAYVSAELGYSGNNYGMLRARAPYPNAWEKFTLCRVAAGGGVRDGVYAISSEANGLYVSSEIAYGGSDYGMLRARAANFGEWERFLISWNGSTIRILSVANYLYASAELGYGGYRQNMVRASAPVADYWEFFDVYNDNGGPIILG